MALVSGIAACGGLPLKRRAVNAHATFECMFSARSFKVAPFSKCSMKIRPMLRVQAAAEADDTTSPISALPGTT
jgi:hypothetical protein